MSRFRKLILAFVAVGAFATGYGVLVQAYPSGGIFGRGEYRGYFTNANDSSGWEVLNVSCSTGGEYGPYNYNNGDTWCNAIPRDLNSASEFIAFIEGRLANGVPNGSYGFGSGSYGDTRARTGAAFIVHTMLGTPDGQRSRPPTSAQMTEWRSRVNQYASAGKVSWNTSSHNFNINSYYQGTDDSTSPNDDAFYDDSNGGAAIVFYNNSNGVEFAIRRACANPVGVGGMDDLDPLSNFTITGRSTVSNASPLPGQTITFSHYIRNAGPTSTSPTGIRWIAEKTSPTPSELVGGPLNAGVMASGQEINVLNHNVTIPANTPAGTQFCERVGWDPINSGGARDGRGTPVCAMVPYDYDLTPSVDAVVNSGGSPITGNVAEPGDTISFIYAVNSGAGTVSQTVTCTYRQATHTGYNEAAPSATFTPSGSNCAPSRTFPANTNTTLVTEVVPASAVNTTICKSLTITPTSESGGTATDQACVLVAAKPYTRVWGGDISAGNGLIETSGVCTNNGNAAIVSWNKRAAGGNAGAGTQFAAYALSRINDFATALYDPGGANAPMGLSFANTNGDATNGWFGGEYGSAPCIPDYYATRPATTNAIPATVAAMTSGNYAGSGNITLGGGSVVNPNNRITLYVDGNLMINSNITYSGTWSADNIPMFEVIVRGNIYINKDVSQLDGVYVAQANSSGMGGEIHTCASTANGFLPLPTNTLYSECDQKLTVNGLFVARQIRLLRTIGTLSQSNASEASTSASVGEAFNFGPALWVKQPSRSTGISTPDYDAIISLPPIL